MLCRIHRIARDSWKYLKREGPWRFVLRVLREVCSGLRRLQQRLLGSFVELRGNTCVLEGLRFSLDSAAISTRVKSHFLKGTYEAIERTLVRKHVARDLPVIEGGGSIGVVSCVTNRLLRDPTQHLVVEANPKLLPILKANRDRNGARFTIVHGALGAHGPDVTFYVHEKSVASSIHQVTNEAVTVPAVSLRELIVQKGWKCVSFICDIEGAEIDLIKSEAATLREHVAVFILEVHPQFSGMKAIEAALQELLRLGFELREHTENYYVYYNTFVPDAR